MKTLQPLVLREKSIPIAFTGGIILKDYNSGVDFNILIIFKNGEVIDYNKNVCEFYESNEIPDYLYKWLENNGYQNYIIYTDPNNIIKQIDYYHLLGEPFKLKSSMKCVK